MLETVGTPRVEFDFEPRDHVELGRMLGAIDIERGAKVSGSRFYFLTGVGAELEFALINLAMDQARDAGFTQVIAPSLVKPRAMDGTGFLGQAADDVYRIEGEDLYLVGTSEVPMAAYHSDEILDGATLPLRYAAFSPCFRKEAGSHGKDTQGIIRVHWFDKVEMFVYTTLEESYAEHQRLLEWEKEFLDKLELAYRVIDVAAGDLGLSALSGSSTARRGSRPRARYRELTSTSNCTEFQTRRLDIRGRFDGRQIESRSPPSTARSARSTRTIVAILETHQQADGSVRVPQALQPYLGGREVLKPVARVTADGWRPRLVALDIDGTLLKWVEGAGDDARGDRAGRCTTPCTGRSTPGAHVVLASGRSPHGMTRIADLLDLHGEDARPALDRGLATAPCVFRYPPLEVVHEETFDARAGRARRPRAAPRRAGRGRGARRRLPGQRALPDGRALRRDDPHRASTSWSPARSAA